MRTTGAGFSCRRRDDHHSSVPADHPRPALNALAVFPLARQLATRFFQIAALSDMDPRSSGTHDRTQRRGRYTGYEVPDAAARGRNPDLAAAQSTHAVAWCVLAADAGDR